VEQQHGRKLSVFAAKDSLGGFCDNLSMTSMKMNISAMHVRQDHLKKKNTIMTIVAQYVPLAPIIRQTI
jgi:hypothetical protein